jgi:hypothetical protein
MCALVVRRGAAGNHDDPNDDAQRAQEFPGSVFCQASGGRQPPVR